MDLKEWFANRRKSKEEKEIKQPLSTEEYCALWRPCFQCREYLYTRDLRSNLSVCPKCQYHFRISAVDRAEQLSDHDSFKELDSALSSADPLGFSDTEAYPKRQIEASRKSGLTEAVITGVCTIKEKSGSPRSDGLQSLWWLYGIGRRRESCPAGRARTRASFASYPYI